MFCPHCGIGTSPKLFVGTAGAANGLTLQTLTGNCSECKDLIVFGRWVHADTMSEQFLLYPTGPRIKPIPPEVTGEFAQDYREALIVLQFSPKASAALSRRLVQHVLREKAGIKKRDLDQEI